jgi:hypothetical protein
LKLRLSLPLLGLALAATLGIVGCKDPDDTGVDVLPDEDLINATLIDTFNVELHPIVLDSAYTHNLSQGMLGQILDPELGTITASTFTQFRIQGTDLSFGSSPSNLTLDSIVLSLDLTEFYGRFDDPLNLEVYEITDNVSDFDTLWSNSFVNFDSTVNFAAGKQINFQGKTGFFDWIDIKLSDSLGRKLLYAPSDSIKSNDAFMDFFGGLAIRATVDGFPSREPGGIFYLDLRSAKSGLTLHYHDTTAAKTYKFIVSDDADRYSRVTRSNASDKLFQSMVADSTNPYPAFAFLQSAALTKLAVTVPGLTNVGPLLVNRAELILNVDPSLLGSENRFIPVEQVYLFLADSTGKAEANSFVSESGYSNNNQGYSFPLTNIVMQITGGSIENNGFILVPNLNGITANRSILAGSGHPNPDLRPKLRVVHTTLPGF